MLLPYSNEHVISSKANNDTFCNRQQLELSDLSFICILLLEVFLISELSPDTHDSTTLIY